MIKRNQRRIILIPAIVLSTLLISFVLFIGSSVFEIMYYNDLSQNLYQAMGDFIETYDPTDPQTNRIKMDEFQQNTNSELMVLDLNGTPINTTLNLQQENTLQRQEIFRFVNTWISNPSLYDSVVKLRERVEFSLIGPFSDMENLILIQPIQQNNVVVKVLFCLHPIQPLYPTTDFIIAELLPRILLAILFALLLLWFWADWYYQPLDDLAKKISSGTKNPDDLKSLGTLKGLSLAAINEITSLTQEKLRFQEELQIYEQEMTHIITFSGRLSHELKSPIGLIRGYAEALKERIQNDSKREYYQSIIIEESFKMEALLNDLMDLACLETGNCILNPLPFQMHPMILKILSTTHLELEKKQCSISIEAPEDIPLVYADDQRIQQVLQNLLNNALKHISNKGQLTVRLFINENNLRVEIKNTGKPIPNELMQLIWRPFYTIQHPEHSEKDGSGLGLAIVQSILSLHGHPFGAKNTENGVLFYFELPICDSTMPHSISI